MTPELFVVILVVVTALIFDFTNGFHDSANAVATAVATKAMTPRTAVVLAAVLNVAGAFLSTEVAKTISGGIVDDAIVTPAMVFAGLVGAILWNLLTWLLGLPSSSSHALFGGLIGAVLVGAALSGARSSGVNFDVVVAKILVPALAAPLIAGLVSALATMIGYRIAAHASNKAENKRMTSGFRYGQESSSSLVALAIGLGTASGGWRIMRTMGHGLTSMSPLQGFAASTSTTAAILASSHMGFGLSTTHVSTGAIVGAGLGRKGGQVRWKTARRMVWAWLFTLPAAALVGAMAALLAGTGTAGVTVMFVLLLLGSTTIWLIARRSRVSANTVNEGPVNETPPPTDPAALVMPAKKKLKKRLAKLQRQREAQTRADPDAVLPAPATTVADERSGS